MKLSIITCTYNSEKYLPECLKSVEAQNLDPSIFEHIFIDGCSTDNTLEIINNYRLKNQGYNIKLIQKQPKGIYNAFNEGIKNAEGEYVNFMNSDDMYIENTINDYLNYIEETGNLDFYYADINYIDENGKSLNKDQSRNRRLKIKGISYHNLGKNIYYICHQTCIYKQHLHKKYGYYNENNKIASDYELLFIVAKNNIRYSYYNKTTVNFRFHTQSISSNQNNDSKKSMEIISIQKKYLGIRFYCYIFLNPLIYIMISKKLGLYKPISKLYRKYLLR